jgi:hypothetical protein
MAPPEVVLSPEAVSRAGIKTAKVEVVDAQTTIQLPGTVMADAYREVKVVPIVGGIVTKVHVDLGHGQAVPLATSSAELAEAQTKYLSMQAMLLPITRSCSARSTRRDGAATAGAGRGHGGPCQPCTEVEAPASACSSWV